jgi:hypothetical protein
MNQPNPNQPGTVVDPAFAAYQAAWAQYQQDQRGQAPMPPGGWAPSWSPVVTAPKRPKRWPWIVGGSVVALFLLIGATSSPTTPAASAAPAPVISAPVAPAPAYVPAYTPAPAYTPVPAPAAPATVASSGTHVKYEVTATKKSSGVITYTSGQNMSIGQQSTARLPWRKELDVTGFFVPTLSAQNSGGGSITCRITVDGAVVSEVTSEGAYSIASCSGAAITGW